MHVTAWPMVTCVGQHFGTAVTASAAMTSTCSAHSKNVCCKRTPAVPADAVAKPTR
eukprot:CAMPEP_0183353024 /NCGR_PEP_ID=MMETSP0164_2-20130417/32223_1 /TAXON_ID=221442 /ORGANISM="Coccolithus pelagicus ssp braarudi, Strain PLY182g" /LENGTH=55 /DNA_ID=CAMNT_0025525619 /DNA_START=298 /DNA_END=465 /DNA_ORIENTATION=-